MLHLRAVAPHVAGLLAATAAASGGKALAAALPRQAAPGVVSTDGDGEAWHSGVSSFAFQVALHGHSVHIPKRGMFTMGFRSCEMRRIKKWQATESIGDLGILRGQS